MEAGRAALLGHTTLLVLPAAYFLFRETPSRCKLIGMAIAMTGQLFSLTLVPLIGPTATWSVTRCCFYVRFWFATIIHIRGHRPVLTPIQLAPFQLMISASFIGILALYLSHFLMLRVGQPQKPACFFTVQSGTALAMMSVTTCVRYLPTVVSTVGLLAHRFAL